MDIDVRVQLRPGSPWHTMNRQADLSAEQQVARADRLVREQGVWMADVVISGPKGRFSDRIALIRQDSALVSYYGSRR